MEEKRDVAAKSAGQLVEFRLAKRLAKERVQCEQRTGGIAAATTESAFGWNVFFEMNANPAIVLCLGQELLGGAPHEVAGVGGDAGLAAGQFDAAFDQLDLEPIKNRHRQHEHLKLMKTILPPADDVEQEVDFAVGCLCPFQVTKKAPAVRRAP